MLEVRSNVVGVSKDDMSAWKKRMDSDEDEESRGALSGIDYDEGDGSEGVTEEELDDSDDSSDDSSDDDKKSEDGDAKSGSDDDDSGDGDNHQSGGGGYADDNENDNEHNGSGYDSSLGAESTRPAVPESTDLGKIVGALSNILTPGSGFRPAAG
jgi:hypothetical protein